MGSHAKRRRQEKEEKEVMIRTPNWSELPPDLLRCVFERLSFTSLNQTKLVCRLWYSASRDCVPQNQIPWLIFFPTMGNRCVIFVPEDDKLYSCRYLGLEFAESVFLRSCGSWFLMLNTLKNLYYILNPFTGERIYLPVGPEITTDPPPRRRRITPCCFWIDKKAKDYLVVLPMSKKFTRKGFNNWQDLESNLSEDVFYDHKKQKLYFYFFDLVNDGLVDIWDFSSGDMPHLDKSVPLPWFRFHHLPDPAIDLPICERKIKSNIVVTVSGDILIIQCIPKSWHPWYFCIYKRNQVDNKWEKTNFLGDEALIYDLGITVTANDSILRIKRNSIYFSQGDDIFVYDLTTQNKEPLPPCILSSVGPFIRTHWFFPS